MNKDLLLKVRDHILEEPHRLIMGSFHEKRGAGRFMVCDNATDGYKLQDYASCGTAACIAGWACLLSGMDYVTERSALELLGCDVSLFYVYMWPDDLRLRYRYATDVRSKAQAAVEMIDRYLKESI